MTLKEQYLKEIGYTGEFPATGFQMFTNEYIEWLEKRVPQWKSVIGGKFPKQHKTVLWKLNYKIFTGYINELGELISGEGSFQEVYNLNDEFEYMEIDYLRGTDAEP